jgi:hypothetical protein
LLRTLRELRTNASTRRIGEQSLKEARDRHIKPYGNGILSDVLINGGFLVAETEPATNNLVGLHLVSVGRRGRPVSFPYRSEFGVRFDEAAKMVQDTADFVGALLSTPPSRATSLESRFFGGRFPEYDEPWLYSYFAIPRSVLKIKADPTEYRELAALYGGYLFWPYRYALSDSAYAANPSKALQAAAHKLDDLARQFLRNNNKSPDFEYDLQNISTQDQVRERIDWLRRLDELYEETLKKDAAAPALVEANKSIATIPWGLEAVTRGSETFFATTASGVVVYWQRLPTGALVVKEISEAEAEHP